MTTSDDAETPPPVGGCIVALDVFTGEVLAAATAPRPDAGALGRGDVESWTAALNDPRRPFFPRLTQMAVAPGSVFKTLTAIAMIESGIDPEAPLHCRGYLDQPDRNRCLIYRRYGVGHGDVTLTDALCQSCNVYFFEAARRMGPEAIALWSRRFGLGEATQHDLPHESAGNVPSPEDEARSGRTWYPGSTLQLAIGQATLTTTPLQVARMMAAIANDGYLVTPRFVRDVTATPAGQPPAAGSVQLASYESTRTTLRERIPGLSPGTLARVREGMRMVVGHHRGTGRSVALDEVAIAGKTGTAEAAAVFPTTPGSQGMFLPITRGLRLSSYSSTGDRVAVPPDHSPANWCRRCWSRDSFRAGREALAVADLLAAMFFERVEHLIGIHSGRVDGDRVLGWPERCDDPPQIPIVTGLLLAKQRLDLDLLPASLQFQLATAGSLERIGGQEELAAGIGKDDRPLVAAFTDSIPVRLRASAAAGRARRERRNAGPPERPPSSPATFGSRH